MKHGVDVGQDRIDDLEREMIRFVQREPFSARVVVSCGSGQSRFARAAAALGHRTYTYDVVDHLVWYAQLQEQGLPIIFKQCDLRGMKIHMLPQEIDAVVCNRVLHYLSFKEATRFLQMVSKRMKMGGQMALGLSGIDSKLGENYTAREQSVEERMGALDSQIADDFHIREEVCLYSLDDARRLIATVPHLSVLSIRESAFGNIKLLVVKDGEDNATTGMK